MVKLEDYTLTELRKIASQFNKKVKITAYSKLKKSELIKLLRNHPQLNIVEGGEKLVVKPKKEEPQKQEEPKKQLNKNELMKDLQSAKVNQLKDYLGEGKYSGLVKVLKGKATGKKIIVHVMALMRAFFPKDFTADLIKEYGVKEMFNKYKNFVKNNSSKDVFIPRDEGEIEGKGLPINGILKPIKDYLPYLIEDGKIFKTRQDRDKDFNKKKEEPKTVKNKFEKKK